jgi:hypothetical protein
MVRARDLTDGPLDFAADLATSISPQSAQKRAIDGLR